MTQLQRIRRHNRIKYHTKPAWQKSLTKYAYVTFAAIVGFSAVAKFYYDAGREMQAYADNGPISPVPAPSATPQIEYITVETLVEAKTEKQKILAYLVEKFGDHAADAITMINKCENHNFDPKATNWNRNGTWDAGVMQINQIHGYSLEDMYDWKQNIDAGYKIWQAAGNKFTPWTCSHVIGQTNYLGK